MWTASPPGAIPSSRGETAGRRSCSYGWPESCENTVPRVATTDDHEQDFPSGVQQVPGHLAFRQGLPSYVSEKFYHRLRRTPYDANTSPVSIVKCVLASHLVRRAIASRMSRRPPGRRSRRPAGISRCWATGGRTRYSLGSWCIRRLHGLLFCASREAYHLLADHLCQLIFSWLLRLCSDIAPQIDQLATAHNDLLGPGNPRPFG